VGENLKTLVPRVVGQTETARQKKKVDRGESRQWNEASFFVGEIGINLSCRRCGTRHGGVPGTPYIIIDR